MTVFECFSVSALALSVINFLLMLPSFLEQKRHKKLRNEMKRRCAEEDRKHHLGTNDRL
jgi:hypothetical protein